MKNRIILGLLLILACGVTFHFKEVNQIADKYAVYNSDCEVFVKIKESDLPPAENYYGTMFSLPAIDGYERTCYIYPEEYLKKLALVPEPFANGVW